LILLAAWLLYGGLLQIEWVIFVILGAILVCDGDAIADWCSLLAAAQRPD
jgi:hypothetical protein